MSPSTSLSAYTLPILAAGVLATIAASEVITMPHLKPGPVHITYWEKWTEFEGEAMRKVVEEFNRSQDKVYVDLLTVSSIERKTLLAIAGDDPPDVAGLFGPNVAQYADDHAIIPLDDYCREKGIRAEQYIPAFWDIGFYNNRVYALPSTPASTALHYNKEMFRAAHLDPEKPPTTIEEMDADADKIVTREKNGQIDKAGFLPAEPGWWNWGWGCIFGGKLWDGKDNLTANSPENIRAFEWVQSWSKRYGAAEMQTFRSGFGNFSSPQNAFLSGKVAMEIQGVWMYNFIDKYAHSMDKPVRQWAAVPFPHPADRPDLAGTTFADEDVLVIPRGAKHPKEAFEFIAFVESQKGMELLCMGQRKNSPLVNVSPEFYKNHPNPFIRLFTDQPKGKNVILPPKIGIWPEYQAELTNAFDEISLLHKTPKEALDYVQARMQPKFKEYRRRLRLRGELNDNNQLEAVR
jgi:ABC-type glycerol-3-phosphate transport system substrate-binding protein